MARLHSDEQLVELCRARNLSATRARLPLDCPHLDRLLRRHEERIARWCVQVLHHREDAADAAQEVMVRIYKGINTFRATSSFKTWIYSITRSVCVDVLERRKALANRETSIESARDRVPERADEFPPVKTLSMRESSTLFQAMFERHITPQESHVMQLHHVDGLSMRSITESLGLANASGARAFLASAKRKLRNHLSIHQLNELGYGVPGGGAVTARDPRRPGGDSQAPGEEGPARGA